MAIHRVLLPLMLLLLLLAAATSGSQQASSEGSDGFHLVGCYKDKASRDLPHLAAQGRMSASRCFGLCSRRGYAYFGLQAGRQCWCGRRFGRYGSADMGDCDAGCDGDRIDFCGGAWRNLVYATDVKVARFNYLGCFKDTGHRDLPVFVSDKRMTVEKCHRLCAGRKFAYFGLQYAGQCFCGNSVGRYGSRRDSECRMRCKGNARQVCGNAWRNSVYATGVEVVRQNYLGCFRDAGQRDLPTIVLHKSVTVERCQAACAARGFAYAGVQFSRQCWCGNSLGRHGRVGDAECRMRCDGNSMQVCGNALRNSVYATGVRVARNPYLGCYRDTGHRDLPKFVSDKSMTKEKCAGLCSRRGFAYFGLQYHSQCFCGNSFGKHGRVPDSQCSMRCRGNARQMCGNAWRNSVYATGVTVSRQKYIGCFKDAGSRDLPHLAANNGASVEKCQRLCAKKRYPYFGLQFSRQCWCGRSFGKHGGVSDTQCRMRCAGNSKEVCGNAWRNSVYATGVEPVRRNYIGCFKDAARRDLKHLASHRGMSVGKCLQLCSKGGFAYAGLQFGSQCFCGNSFGQYGRVGDAECLKSCDGNRNQVCGSTWRNSVYATGVKVARHNYVGCFIDSARRDLPQLAGSGRMTVARCYRLCSRQKFPYFGLQHSSQCWCGDTVGRYGRVADAQCRDRCSANRNQVCGGSWRNSVYATGVAGFN